MDKHEAGRPNGREELNPAPDRAVPTPERTEERDSALTVSLRVPMAWKDLDDRQRRGVALWRAGETSNGLVLLIGDDVTLWHSKSDPTRAYQVTRATRNRRGKVAVEYACACGDFAKNGRIDCLHIFAEKLRRAEVVIEERPARTGIQANRRPARKTFAADGTTPTKSAQRTARVNMRKEVHRLINSLVARSLRDDPVSERRRRGGQRTAAVHRAATILHKIVEGSSADAMVARYQTLITGGILALARPPHQNTQSQWMNDPELTAVLKQWLQWTAAMFRQCEVGAIADSSKISQMSTAHPRYIEYGSDERGNARWMKLHALVGVNTLIVMAALFSGNRGKDTHDSKFLQRLVQDALKNFKLKYLLADKAYLSGDILGWLWARCIKAVIPIKKRWDPTTKRENYEAAKHLAEWYDARQQDFHEIYRLRPKIESFFSCMKRVTSGFCSSRGRRRRQNTNEPCVAWVNETLCKLIYMNLRTTVVHEILTNWTVDYCVPEGCLPALAQPVLAA